MADITNEVQFASVLFHVARELIDAREFPRTLRAFVGPLPWNTEKDRLVTLRGR